MATRTPSQAELDLEARQASGYVGESNLGKRVQTLQPDPRGAGAFVGTDPIYQVRANTTEQPSASGDGAEKIAEDAFKAPYAAALAAAPSQNQVSNPGMGGQAVKTQSAQTSPPVLHKEVNSGIITES